MRNHAAGLPDAHERLLIDEAIAAQGDRPGALLGILEAVQTANPRKYLSAEALGYIAEKTGIPPSQVYSVATFYALFNLTPEGENVVCVCRGTACHTRGSRDLLETVSLELCLDWETMSATGEADKLAQATPDSRFTVRTVACFGQCAMAPVAEMNHRVLGHVNERTLLREVKARGRERK